jgi:hypothetical protein
MFNHWCMWVLSRTSRAEFSTSRAQEKEKTGPDGLFKILQINGEGGGLQWVGLELKWWVVVPAAVCWDAGGKAQPRQLLAARALPPRTCGLRCLFLPSASCPLAPFFVYCFTFRLVHRWLFNCCTKFRGSISICLSVREIDRNCRTVGMS